MPRSAPQLVRYVSPFGSPATLPAERAQELLAQDTPLWEEFLELGLVTESQRRIGAPRIGDTRFRLSEMPEWVEGADDFAVIRELVRTAEQHARNRGMGHVVAVRAGRAAVVPTYLTLDDDLIVWTALP